MAQAKIKINGVDGSNDDLPIGTLIQLDNHGVGGEATYLWAIIDQPEGAADALSSTVIHNPTLTPNKEGTYLLQLTVNGDPLLVDTRVAAVRQLKSGDRIPAADETVQDNAVTGWKPAVNAMFQRYDTTQADSNQIVAQSFGGAVVNQICRVTGFQTIKAGLPGQENVPLLSAAGAGGSGPLAIITAAVRGGSPSNTLVYARVFGPVPGSFAGDPNVGDRVYVDQATSLPTLTATVQVAGHVVSHNGGAHTFTWVIDGHINATQGSISAGIGDELSVKDYGALGNWDPTTHTGADDRAAIIACIAAAMALGKGVVFPPGNYKLSKVVPIVGAVGLKIRASALVSIYYPSDDTTLIPDSSINPFDYGAVRSGFRFNGCRNVAVENIEFVGGTSQELTNCNVGVGIFATRTVGMRVTNCRGRDGGNLYGQNALVNANYAGGSTIAVAAGIVTFTNAGDPNGAFHGGMVGALITVEGATNPVNNGVFEILTVTSSTVLTYANAAAIAEGGSPANWSVNDGDDDTVLTGCTWNNCRTTAFTGNGGTFQNCRFYRQMTQDMTGIPDSFAISGTTVTLSDKRGSWPATVVGNYIKIAGATSGGNNGVFQIVSATPRGNTFPATLTYVNASGVAELAPQSTCVWWIANGERVGIGAGVTAIANAAGVVTFTAASSIFRADDVGKTLRITDATSAANDGNFVIISYVSATQVLYLNSGAVSETYAKVFSVDGFDSTKGDSIVGPAISSTSTAVGVNSLTDNVQAMTTNAYSGRYLIDSGLRQWKILSNTATVFTLVGGGATPAAGAYTVSAGATHGSTHGVYYFAGRSRCKVLNCIFRGVRTTAVKISGSSAPIHDMEIAGNVFDECGAAIVAGADDAQEHIGFNFHHNLIRDCSTGRSGWNDQTALCVLGARNVLITHNQFYASHDAVPALVNAGSLGGYYGIFAARYVGGISQPLEDATIEHNTFDVDPACTLATRVASVAIHAERVGQRARWRTGGTLAKQLTGPLSLTISTASTGSVARGAGSWITDGYVQGGQITMSGFTNGGNNTTKTIATVSALTIVFTSNAGLVNETHSASTTNNVMTLTDSSAQFNQTIVGDSIQICFAPDAGNNNTVALETKVTDWTVLSVTGTSALTFINAAGVGGGVGAGTYRIKPKQFRGGQCSISHNKIFNYGTFGIETMNCTAPQIIGNTFNGILCVNEGGSVAPHIAHNVQLVAASPTNAGIVITTATAWPTIYDNFVTNGALAGGNLLSEFGATRTDIGVGIGSNTPVEHPLLGKHGRCKSSGASAENVFAFGSDLVDGDTFSYIGTACTYKASAPGAHQFNDQASLIALLAAIANVACADYGAQFSVSVTTGHIWPHYNLAGTGVSFYIDTINTLNDTALVIPRNAVGGGESYQTSRGDGSAGPTATRFVVWSMQNAAGAPIVQADNAAAAALMSGGWFPDKPNSVGGCCYVFKSNTVHDGTEEWTWRLP